MKKGDTFYDYWLYNAEFKISKDKYELASNRFKRFISSFGEFENKDNILKQPNLINLIESLGLIPNLGLDGDLIGFSQPDDVDLCMVFWSDYAYIFLQYFSGVKGGENLIDGKAKIEIANYDEESDSNVIHVFEYSNGNLSDGVYRLQG